MTASQNAARLTSLSAEQAMAQGAKVACGGKVPAWHNVGWFYEPTVLTGVTPDMAIVRAELFGPVAPVIKVGSLDEAIALSNASRYGLGAAIYTNRLDEAIAATEWLEAGMVWVNNVLGDNDGQTTLLQSHARLLVIVPDAQITHRQVCAIKGGYHRTGTSVATTESVLLLMLGRAGLPECAQS